MVAADAALRRGDQAKASGGGVIFELRPETKEGGNPANIWKKRASGHWISRCKGPEAEQELCAQGPMRQQCGTGLPGRGPRGLYATLRVGVLLQTTAQQRFS